jgi:hypothetical protein
VATDGVVGLSDGEGVSGAARGQCFEAEVFQQSRTAGIPRIGNNKCSGALVKFNKLSALSAWVNIIVCPHFCGVSPKVSFNYLNKVLASRRMIRLLWATVKFARASNRNAK